MKTAEALALCMMIAVVSFLGFVVENIWLSATKGYIDNRNMCLPFLIGYGLAIVAIYLLLGTPKSLRFIGKKWNLSRFSYFLVVMLCVSVGEILLGKLVEKTCCFYWWDYTKIPLHITRYTSLPTSAAFSVLIVTFMNGFFEPLYRYFLSWDAKVLRCTAMPLMVLLVWDYLYNACLMYKKKEMIPRWKVDTKNTKGYRLLHS